nr:isoform 2 of flowering time control protein fpa [Quercus suber]
MPPSNNKSMMMNTRLGRIGGNSDESKTPATPMMMNNHASDVADSDLMDLFAQYGVLDCVTSYSCRSYAFVFFKRIEVAKAAKDTLHGVDLHGHPIKSESDSEAGIGLSGADAKEEESGSKIGCQEPGLSEVVFLRSCSLIAGLLGL